MKLLAALLLCASLALANTCAAAASGDYGTVGTWTACGSTVPQAADAVTIGGSFTVTCSGACVGATVTQAASANTLIIANGGTLTVGASTAGNVLTINAGATLTVQTGGTLVYGSQPATPVAGLTITGTGAVLNVSGTVTMQNNLIVTTHAILAGHAGGVLQASPGANTTTTGAYQIVTQTNLAPIPQVTSNATTYTSPFTISTLGGTGSNNVSLSGNGFTTALSLAYTVLSKCGGGAVYCVDKFSSTTFDHVLLAGPGGLRWTTTGTTSDQNTLSLSYMDFRNVTDPASLAFTSPGAGAITGQPRFCRYCTFWAPIANYATALIIPSKINDMTWVDPVFAVKVILTGVLRQTFINPMFISDGDVGNNQRLNFDSYSGSTITGGGMILSSAYTGSPHTFYDGVSADTEGPNVIDGFVFEGYNTSSATQQWSSGGPHIVRNSLYITGASLATNTVYAALQKAIYSHNTFYKTTTDPTVSGFRCESLGGPNKFAAVNNSIFSTLPSVLIYGVCNLGGAVWVPQHVSNCTVDTANPLTLAGSTLTVPVTGACSINVNDGATFKGLTGATWLNGKTVWPATVTGTAPSVTSFTADLTKSPVLNAPGSYSANDGAGVVYGGFFMDDNVVTGLTSVTGPSTRVWNRTAGASGVIWTLAATAHNRTTFTSAGSVNPCSTINTAGTNAGTIPGDYVYSSAAPDVIGIVETVPSSTQLTVNWNGSTGAAGLGAGNCANGATITVLLNYWASGIYGDVGKGSRELAIPPRFFDPSRTPSTWDLSIGGPGTTTHAAEAMIARNGWDKTGTLVTPNPLATVENYMRYIRLGLTPTNLALMKQAGDGLDPGAIPITIYNAPGITGGGVY